MANVVIKKPKPTDTPFPPELFQMAALFELVFVFEDERRTIIWGCQETKWPQ